MEFYWLNRWRFTFVDLLGSGVCHLSTTEDGGCLSMLANSPLMSETLTNVDKEADKEII